MPHRRADGCFHHASEALPPVGPEDVRMALHRAARRRRHHQALRPRNIRHSGGARSSLPCLTILEQSTKKPRQNHTFKPNTHTTWYTYKVRLLLFRIVLFFSFFLFPFVSFFPSLTLTQIPPRLRAWVGLHFPTSLTSPISYRYVPSSLVCEFELSENDKCETRKGEMRDRMGRDGRRGRKEAWRKERQVSVGKGGREHARLQWHDSEIQMKRTPSMKLLLSSFSLVELRKDKKKGRVSERENAMRKIVVKMTGVNQRGCVLLKARPHPGPTHGATTPNPSD